MSGESSHGSKMCGESSHGSKMSGESSHGSKMSGESSHGSKMSGESSHGPRFPNGQPPWPSESELPHSSLKEHDQIDLDSIHEQNKGESSGGLEDPPVNQIEVSYPDFILVFYCSSLCSVTWMSLRLVVQLLTILRSS